MQASLQPAMMRVTKTTPALQRGFTVAFDYNFFGTPGGIEQVYIERESDLGGQQTEAFRNHFHVHLHHLGVLPDEAGPVLDSTTNCSASLSTVPWTAVRVPVGATIRSLVAMNLVDAEVVEGAKYAGGIIGGPETWGRSRTIEWVKGHRLLLKESAEIRPLGTTTIVPEGQFRVANDADRHIYYSNGVGDYCLYATYLHAGVNSILDVDRVFDRAPPAVENALFCPGGETFGDQPRIQELGVYPEGRFRTKEDGLSYMYYSNGNNAYCRYPAPQQLGVVSANAITQIYDNVPRNMGHDVHNPFCPGGEQFFPK